MLGLVRQTDRQIAIGSKALDLCSLHAFALTLLEHGTRDDVSSTGVKQFPDAVHDLFFEWLFQIYALKVVPV